VTTIWSGAAASVDFADRSRGVDDRIGFATTGLKRSGPDGMDRPGVVPTFLGIRHLGIRKASRLRSLVEHCSVGGLGWARLLPRVLQKASTVVLKSISERWQPLGGS
jgi:hypothetical protein